MKSDTWKIFLALIISLALPGVAKAQQNFASISFGVSQPLGDYKATESLESSGYAKAGGVIKFDAAYFPSSYLGIGGSLSYGSNYSLGEDILEDIVDYISENGTNPVPIPDDALTFYTSGFWNYFNLFIGPHFSIRASQRIYFDFRILGGPTIIKLPDQQLQVTFDQIDIYTVATGNKLTFGFSAGSGMRIKLNDMLALKLGVDFTQSRAKLDYDFEMFSELATEIPPVEARFAMRSLEFSAGLAYAF